MGRKMISFRAFALLSCTTLAASGVLMAAPAQAEEARRSYNIPAQPLAAAIVDFSRQSDAVVTASSNLTRGKGAPAVQGTFLPQQALQMLISGSGLTAAPRRNGGFVLVAAEAPGGASNPESESSNGDDIVVTAQKREQNLKDVPISIAVVSGEKLDRSSVRGVTEVLDRTAGVSVTIPGQTGGTQITLRGVTAGLFFLSGSSTVGYYLDQAPFGMIRNAVLPDTSAYDLERVEVLRGPQGTLYGASSLNGVVRVLPHQAELDDFSAKGRASISGTRHGGANYRGDAAINVPLVPGVLAARGVIGYQDESGWIDKPGDPDANTSKNLVGRLRLDAQPNDRLTLAATAWLSRIDRDAGAVSDRSRKYGTVLAEPIDTDFDAYGFKASYDLGTVTVSSMTNYVDYSVKSFIDLSFLFNSRVLLETSLFSKMFSQEVVANSNDAGPIEWTLGGIYRKSKDRTLQNRELIRGPTDFTDRSKSFAVYGQVTGRLLDDTLEITGGLRYFHDSYTLNENAKSDGTSNPLLERKQTYKALTPKVSISWRPADDLNIYATYSQGFRSGVDQDPSILALVPGLQTVKPDRLTNYEIGVKGQAFDKFLDVDVSLYYIKWKNTQLRYTIEIDRTGRVALVNGPGNSGPGVDIMLTLHPAPWLTFGGTFGWNDLTFDETIFVPVGGVQTALYPKGSRSQNSPKYTAGGFIELEVPVSESLSAGFDMSGNYTSERLERGATALAKFLSDEVFYLRAQASLKSQDRWTASIFVDNLTDTYATATARAVNANPAGFVRPRPRTIGVQLETFF